MNRRGHGLRLLGRAAIIDPNGEATVIRSGQVAAVLAMLWDERRPVRRDELAALLWGEDHLPDHWAGAVRGVVAKARAALVRSGIDADALRTESGTVELVLPDGSPTDLADAQDLVDRAETSLDAGDLVASCDLAHRAMGMLVEPVAIAGEGDWTRRLHDRVVNATRRARQISIEALLGLGRSSDAVSEAELAIRSDPFDEVAYALAMQAQLAVGRPAAARRIYVELTRVFRDELGIEPSIAAPGAMDGHPPTRSGITPVDTVGRFLGRQAELATLRNALHQVTSTHRPALVVIEGPAGIGKTRLAREFVESSGADHLWGRCHRHAGVPFEPFVDAVRGSLAEDVAGVLSAAARAGLDRMHEPSSPSPQKYLGDNRAAVMRDVVAMFASLAGDRPVGLVIDDIHWASGDTIALTQRVLEDADAPILVVATMRDQSDDPAGMADLLRAAPATFIALEGIDEPDLIPLAEDLSDDIEPEAIARLLHRRTGGLAYFVDEIARELRRQGGIDATVIPDTVRAWVRQRIETLPASSTKLLELAAVIATGGDSEVPVSIIEAVDADEPDGVLIGLEALAHDGFLTETAIVEQYAFAHEISREVVESRIGSARRARLHVRVADVLSETADPPLATIAHHYRAGGPRHRYAATWYTYRAAVASLRASAWALADDQASEALVTCPDDDVALRTSLLCTRGSALHGLGHPTEAVDRFGEAITLAETHRFPHHLARATLGLVGRGGRGAAVGMDDNQRVTLLRGALDALQHWDIPERMPAVAGVAVDATALAHLRCAVEVELAWALLFTGSLAERRELVEGALERARADNAAPARLARALVAQRNVLHGPGEVLDRLGVMQEAVALPRDQVAAEVQINAELGRHEDLLALDDFPGARVALDAAGEIAEHHGHPYWRWAVATWESLWLLIGGDPDAAEKALDASVALQMPGSPEVVACTTVQTVAIRLAQDRAAEVVDVLAYSAEAHPEVPCYAAVLALCQSRAGDLVGAQRTFEGFSRNGFSSIPIDSNRLLSVAVLGEVAADLGDGSAAQTLHRMLEPDDACNVVLNCYGGGGAWWGPVARIRERLATLTI